MQNGELDRIARRMQEEWDARAAHDARYFVRQSVLEQDEGSFEASGETNVRSFVEPDLNTICGGRDPKTCCVLEIGCGVGRLTRHLAGIFGKVDGVDVSAEMIRKGRERLRDLTNVDLHVGSGVDLAAFTDDSFDFAFSYIVFQHIPDKRVIESYLREAARVLKPAAVFKFQVHGGDSGYEASATSTWSGAVITEQEIRDWAHAIGFEVVHLAGFGSQYAWATLKVSPEKTAVTGPPALATPSTETKSCPVRVVVPVFGRPSYDGKLLARIEQATIEPDADFVWVDCRRDPSAPLASVRGSIIPGDPCFSFEDALLAGTRDLDEPYWAGLCERAIPRRGWLGALVAAAEEHPEFGAIGAPLLRVRASGHVDRLTPEPGVRHLDYALWQGDATPTTTAPIGAVLFRRARQENPCLAIEQRTSVSTFDLEPDFYHAWLVDLGERYEEKGLLDDAEERLLACEKLFPKDARAAAALERIRALRSTPGEERPQGAPGEQHPADSSVRKDPS